MSVLTGEDFDDFVRALGEAEIDLMEAMQLCSREPGSVEEWRGYYFAQAECWRRLATSLALLGAIATGVSPSDPMEAGKIGT